MADYNFRLKNGLEAEIDVLDFHDLEQICNEAVDSGQIQICSLFEGFHFMGPYVIESYKNDDKNPLVPKYCEETRITPLEFQEEKKENNHDYHKFITASLDEELVGVMFLPWINPERSFWRYNIGFVDVHENLRNQGIAKNMYIALDSSDFIKGKILENTRYTEDGSAFLKDRIDKRYLQANDYALIHVEQGLEEAPKEFGKQY